MKHFLKVCALACAFMMIGHEPVVAQGNGAATQAQGEGEEEAACKTCKHNYGTNEHWFGGWFSGCTSGAMCYDCHAFNACHSGPQAPFACGANHWLCGATGAALDAIDKALTAPNSESAILRVANSDPKTVRIVSAGYVLVKNCNGAIVAAFKLSKPPSAKAPLVVAAANATSQRAIVKQGLSRTG
jgi:hypothetical protein